MTSALAVASTATFETIARFETSNRRIVPPPSAVRRSGLWATLRRVGRWLTKAAGWLSSPKGQMCLTLAGEGLVFAGTVSRATMSDTLDAVSLAVAPFAPTRREGPRVIWG
jgi:hypothetical protein